MGENTNYYVSALTEFKESIKDIKHDIAYPTKDDFQVLLTAVYSLIEGSDFTNFVMHNVQGVSADRNKVLSDLESFKIFSEESALRVISQACGRGTHWQYAQFIMYRENAEFRSHVDNMPSKPKRLFDKSREFSEQFEELTGNAGFFAWDIALTAHLIRECVFCDYFDEPSGRGILDDLMKPLLKTINSWEEFAVSFIAGGTYSAYKNSDFDEEEAKKTFDELLGLCKKLFHDENTYVWKVFNWFVEKDYFPMLDKNNLEPLVKSEKGCFVSDRISLDGVLPCMIYREEPFPNFPDSGWRFFAGDESKEYSANINNSNIFTLNVIANYDPTVIPLLDAPIGTVYMRKEGAEFVESKMDVSPMNQFAKDDVPKKRM